MAPVKENGRKILVAMDNSKFAHKALEEAVRLAKLFNARLSVLCVAPTVGVLDEMPPGFAEKMTTEAQKIVDKAVEIGRDHSIEVDGSVQQGPSPAEQIVDYAQEYGFELIVMGHKGKGNLERFLVGSVAERVVAHAPCSVLIVR